MQGGAVSSSATTVAAMAAVGLPSDLKKRIEIMAAHVAQQGAEFENSVKSKNAGNSQFAFLLGGEGAEYYTELLKAHRAPQAAGTATTGQADAELSELLRRWREPHVVVMPPEIDRQLAEIIASLATMASRDAVRHGRTWIEANVSIATGIAGNMMKRVSFLATCAHRIHVLFLLHDVLQTEVTKQGPARPLVNAFKPYLVWMLRSTYQLALTTAQTGDERDKVLKLLQLWAERGIISSTEAEEMKTIVTTKELPGVAKPPPPAPPSLPTPGLLQQVQAAVAAQPQQVSLAKPPMPPAPPAVVPPPRPAGFPRPPGLQALPPVAPPPGSPMSGALQSAASLPAALPTALPAMPGRGPQTPETVPVGVMALMLKQVSRRGKDMHTAFVPYKPLDPLYTPQVFPPTAPPTERLLKRLDEYYEAIGDVRLAPALALPPAEDDSANGTDRAASRSRSRSPARPATAGVAIAPPAVNGSPVVACD